MKFRRKVEALCSRRLHFIDECVVAIEFTRRRILQTFAKHSSEFISALAYVIVDAVNTLSSILTSDVDDDKELSEKKLMTKIQFSCSMQK